VKTIKNIKRIICKFYEITNDGEKTSNDEEEFGGEEKYEW